MESKLYTFEEVVAFIKQGFVLSLAGDERVLSKLPPGNWIGGTIPYFMDVDCGKFNQELIFVNEIEMYNSEYSIKVYDENSILNIASDSYDNGYSLLILPAFQKINEVYSIQTENINGLYDNPIVGWVSGMDLNSSDTPKTFSGLTGKMYEDKGVVLHVKLPENLFAQVDIVNIFNPDIENDEIKFYNNSFDVTSCMINGKDVNLAEYVTENGIDSKLPLIADYSGASINVCIKEVDVENGKVSFFGPLFKSKSYKFAKAIPSYINEFDDKTKELTANNVFSCNCVLNYLYGDLEGKKINNAAGPVTFGEIAYNLLNQTLVVLTIDEI